MPTCPNCGEIVMNGDPYCPHCGTTFRWVEEEYEMRYSRGARRPIEVRLLDISIQAFYRNLEKLQEPSHITAGIRNSIDISKVRDARVNIVQPYPGGDIDISIIRKNKYFSTTDSIVYDYSSNEIGRYGFRSSFNGLNDAEWFRSAVRKKESITGRKFHECAGGYDAHWETDRANILELRPGCKVVAHFIKDEYSTIGYEVDFKNHRLKDEPKRYDRISTYDLVMDYDWD